MSSIAYTICTSEVITLTESSLDSRGQCSTIIPESILPPSPTSMEAYFDDISEPARASVDITTEGGEAVYDALSEMWNEGDVVLRGMRVTAPESSLDKGEITRFFLYFIIFMETLTEKWDQSARKEVTKAAKKFKDALRDANDYASIIRAVDCGYEFRDSSFRCINAHQKTMDETVRMLQLSDYHAELLMMLAQGLSGSSMSKLKFLFKTADTAKWTAKFGVVQWAIATKRAQRKVVRSCANKADKFVQKHKKGGETIKNRLLSFFK